MCDVPYILIENKIPFIKGRLEGLARVEYVDPEDFCAERVRGADAVIVRTRTRCDASLLSGSNVRLVVTATIGTDHIDMGWCADHGIMVRNAPGCNAPAVAQYVWGELLLMGVKPEGVTIGVVGHGNVGSIVARWGEMLGARVLLCDPPKSVRLGREGEGRYMSLEEMLPLCDVVSLHTPLTFECSDATFHLIDSARLELMREGSILINAARGGVAETSALLTVGKRRGLRLVTDCWEGEPEISDELLEQSEVATPHIAGYSAEGKQRATRMAVEAVTEFFKGEGIFRADVVAPTEGLTPAYVMPEVLSGDDILRGFAPVISMADLKRSDVAFERLRSAYPLHREP